jgi:hypothetical protein
MSSAVEALQRWTKVVDAAAPGFLDAEALAERLPPPPPGAGPAVLDAQAQKTVLLEVKRLLEESPARSSEFARASGWQLLDQILAATRLRELSRVKIVKRGGRGGLRYDVGELAQSYYGRQILESVQFNVKRRKIADKAEFEIIREACAKLKLTLPEAVEPTTTEKFFATKDDES